MMHQLDFLLCKCKIDHLKLQKIPMKDKTRASDVKECKKEAAINRSIRKANYGDLLWVQLHGSSWWPAQVVDDSTVSAIHKPRKISKGEVLVRLYGSYKYLFVDPISSHLEFEDTLDKYSGSYDAILEESLKKDLHQLKFGTSKKKEKKLEGKVGADISKLRTVKKKQSAISKTGTKKVSSSANGKQEQVMECKKPKANGAVSPGTSSGRASAGAARKTSLKRASLSSDKSKQGNNKKQKQSETRKNPQSPNSLSRTQGSANQGHSSSEKMGSPRTKVKTPITVQKKLRKSDAAKISQENKDAGRKKNAKSSKQEILSTPLEETAKEPSARKLKVMRFLGLVSPAGSPFTQNGSISHSA